MASLRQRIMLRKRFVLMFPGVDLLTIGFYGLNDSTEQLFGMGYGNTTIMDLALIDFEVK